MKKGIKRKSASVSSRVEPDIGGMIGKMQQQLASMERKIDILIGQPPIRQSPARIIEVKQENRFRERILHKAICADCNKECEVPFKPSGDRPVYCKDCFSKRKNGAAFKAKPDNKSKVEIGAPVPQPVEKKKPAAKRRKKRA
jgi:CxxC-x17-CxxC domain-containing protein